MTSGHERHRATRADPELRLPADGGGLVIIGPLSNPAFAIDEILSRGNAAPIKVDSDAISTWKSASAEALRLARSASAALRNGQLAVVYLDAHVAADVMLPPERHEFVCDRLGQIMRGLADKPVYLALHGQRLAQSIVGDALGDYDVPVLGPIAEVAELWQLNSRALFPRMPVAVVPASQNATIMSAAIDWLESQRS